MVPAMRRYDSFMRTIEEEGMHARCEEVPQAVSTTSKSTLGGNGTCAKQRGNEKVSSPWAVRGNKQDPASVRGDDLHAGRIFSPFYDARRVLVQTTGSVHDSASHKSLCSGWASGISIPMDNSEGRGQQADRRKDSEMVETEADDELEDYITRGIIARRAVPETHRLNLRQSSTYSSHFLLKERLLEESQVGSLKGLDAEDYGYSTDHSDVENLARSKYKAIVEGQFGVNGLGPDLSTVMWSTLVVIREGRSANGPHLQLAAWKLRIGELDLMS
jgi:hypothetical protein